jgi:amidase
VPAAGIPVIAAGGLRAPPVADAFVRRFTLEPTGSGRLRGLSFAVKDLFDIAGLHTGCGNPSWRATHGRATTHAAAVRRLLDAGARFEGTTRTDELAYSLEGCNFHEGAPLNPAAPSRLTGGSSSGAASAVAAGEVDFAVGTDTAGSVRVPASWCGVLGFRPTHGGVSMQGVTPLAPSFDTVGWLARSGAVMRDVGTVLLGDGTSANAAAHGTSANAAAHGTSANAAASRTSAVRADREWVYDPALEALGGAGAEASDPAAAQRLAEQGGALRELPLGIDWAGAAQCLRVLQAAEAWHTHGRWIETARPVFGPAVASRFSAARDMGDDQVRHAERDRAAFIERLDAVLPPGRILRLPSVPEAAPRRDAVPGDLTRLRTRLFPLTAIASLAGRPQISLPVGRIEGAPVGVSLLGWRGGDHELLRIAAAVFP